LNRFVTVRGATTVISVAAISSLDWASAGCARVARVAAMNSGKCAKILGIGDLSRGAAGMSAEL
jgi:hypothetical protein